MYICPVCGYDQLQHRPADFAICPSCYTEFGYDDSSLNHLQLREEWLKNGARWEGANVMPPPPGWSASEQLRNLLPQNAQKTETRIGIIEVGHHQTVIDSAIAKITLVTRDYVTGKIAGPLLGTIQPARITS